MRSSTPCTVDKVIFTDSAPYKRLQASQSLRAALGGSSAKGTSLEYSRGGAYDLD